MDDELSPRARNLVDKALEADVPPPSVADGSWEIVVSRLTIEAESAGAPAALAVEPHRARARWVVVVVVGMVIAATAALGWIVSRPRPVLDAKQPTAPTKAAAPAKASTPTDPAAELPAPAMDAAAIAKLLDDAEAATPEAALELLARHAELSPLGPNSERRMALRITTLCALGRVDDARADAVAFLSRPRDAKWTAKVRESCAGR